MYKKLLWIIGSIMVGITVLAVIGFTIYKSDIFSKETIVVEEPKESFPQYDQLTIDIAEYEYYNNHPFLYSRAEAEFFSLTTTLENYALFHHLQQHDYTWDEEKINRYMQQERDALAIKMEHPTMKAYYEKLFNDLNITFEQYIEHYAFINAKAEQMKLEMFGKGIGLDEGMYYPSSDVFTTYIALVGITEQQLDELALRNPELLDPAQQQIELPFFSGDSHYKVALNDEGQYIFTSMQTPIDLAREHSELFYELKRIVEFDLTRVTFPFYVEALESYVPKDETKPQLKEDLQLYFELLERTMNSL